MILLSHIHRYYNNKDKVEFCITPKLADDMHYSVRSLIKYDFDLTNADFRSKKI